MQARIWLLAPPHIFVGHIPTSMVCDLRLLARILPNVGGDDAPAVEKNASKQGNDGIL